MNVVLPVQAFKDLIRNACKVLDSSALGHEIVSAETGPVFWLRAKESVLTLDLAARGLEMSVQVPTTSCEEEGELAINPYLLNRLAVRTQEINLIGTESKLDLKAGRFKTSIAAFQGVKHQNYDEVPLTHSIPSKWLLDGLSRTTLVGNAGQPFSRISWSEKGVRVWTHNSYNAAYSLITDDSAEEFSVIVPVPLIAAVAGASQSDLRLGMDQNAIRFQNNVVDISHPLQTDIEIEDVESVFQSMDRDSIPSLEIDPAKLLEALNSIGSVDHKNAGSAQSGVNLWVNRAKKRLVLSIQNSVGQTVDRVDLQSIRKMDEDVQVRLNHRQLSDFTNRSKNQKLSFGFLDDRVILWSGATIYMMAPVQEEATPEDASDKP